MPVSRKRKKKSQSGRRSQRQPAGPPQIRASQADALSELFAYRSQLGEHRAVLAGTEARAMIEALVAAAPGWSDDDLEDHVCLRYGAAMAQYDAGAVEDVVNPDDLVRALLTAIDQRLHQSAEAGTDVAVLRRLLTVLAGVLPSPLSESTRALVAKHLGTHAARQAGRGRAVTGPVLWAHDVYGTRWAVVAPFSSVAGPDRWYLWDVDTCGYEIVTMHSGFHPTVESAVTAWRESVGHAAAGAAALTVVDNAETLGALLLRGDVEGLRVGGEDQEQYAEFLRSRRLGRTVRDAVGKTRGQPSVRLTADEAREGFAQRLRQLGHHDGSDEGPAGADDLAAELADSWSPGDHPTLYPFCSPHKVAVAVLHLRDFYKDEFAAELVAVLPEWIRFLAEHTAMAAELTERCLAYASGELQFPGILDDHGRPNPMARVTE
ncbi:hypothetical protein [Phytohabitans houttuyneae]|uniref:Uncharacterized protein n=1 Tax=Phytohabitans houttuyneae TaxID=1076126 RepID=A0A6V8KAZ2_9ACTN|nr:hypothetical protein [Phytohabitans houttuyneae]GFJ79126.1 hypothetical protein Phou_033060 [Phytohabitans houttuyneae]